MQQAQLHPVGPAPVFVDLDDREVTQWICTQGYFVTDLSSLIFEKPARWNIQALIDTAVYTIDRADYNRIGDYISEMAFDGEAIYCTLLYDTRRPGIFIPFHDCRATL